MCSRNSASSYTYGTSGQASDPSTAPAYLRQITHLVNGSPVQTYPLTHSYLDQLIGYTGVGANGDTEAAQYAYDMRGRLTGEARTRTVGGQTFNGAGNYSYDNADNLNAGANGWVYDADNRPVSAPPAGGLPGASNLSYDAAGNTLTVDDKTLTYDVWGNLVSVTRVDPATGVATWRVSYTYDPLGRRYSRAYDNGAFTSTTVYDYDGLTRIGQETLPPTVSTLGGGGGGYRGMVFPHSPLFDGQKGARLFAALARDGSHKGGPHADVWQALPGLAVGGATSVYPDFAAFAKPLANLSIAQSSGGGYTSYDWGPLGNLFGLQTIEAGQISAGYRGYGPQGNLTRQFDSNGNPQYQEQNAQTSMGNRAEGPGGSSPPPYSSNFGSPSGNDDDDVPLDSNGKSHLYDGLNKTVNTLSAYGQAAGNFAAGFNPICNFFTAKTGQDASGKCVSKFDRVMAGASLVPGALVAKVVSKGKNLVKLERFMGAEEAALSKAAKGLVPKYTPHQNNPKWIAEAGRIPRPQVLGKPGSHTHKMTMSVSEETMDWIRSISEMKDNEPGRYAIPSENLGEFNGKIVGGVEVGPIKPPGKRR